MILVRHVLNRKSWAASIPRQGAKHFVDFQFIATAVPVQPTRIFSIPSRIIRKIFLYKENRPVAVPRFNVTVETDGAL